MKKELLEEIIILVKDIARFCIELTDSNNEGLDPCYNSNLINITCGISSSLDYIEELLNDEED